jgi:hypothetical protein
VEPRTYNGYLARPRAFELQAGGFNLDLTIEKHTNSGVHMQNFKRKRSTRPRLKRARRVSSSVRGLSTATFLV